MIACPLGYPNALGKPLSVEKAGCHGVWNSGSRMLLNVPRGICSPDRKHLLWARGGRFRHRTLRWLAAVPCLGCQSAKNARLSIHYNEFGLHQDFRIKMRPEGCFLSAKSLLQHGSRKTLMLRLTAMHSAGHQQPNHKIKIASNPSTAFCRCSNIRDGPLKRNSAG